MDATIKASLVTIQAIIEIVQDIKETPKLIERISLQVKQLGSTLNSLHNKLPSYILSNTEIENWINHQNVCNKLLHDIEDILEDYARSQKTHPVWGPIKFKFSVKGDLQQLFDDLQACVSHFRFHSDLALNGAKRMPSPESLSQQSSKTKDQVVSLGQFAQIQIEARREAMCEDLGSSQLGTSCGKLVPSHEILRPS